MALPAVRAVRSYGTGVRLRAGIRYHPNAGEYLNSKLFLDILNFVYF
jgi:hypothetical protein